MMKNKSKRIMRYFITIVFCLLIFFTKNIQAQNVYIEADQYDNKYGSPTFAPWVIIKGGTDATGNRYIMYTNESEDEDHKYEGGDDDADGQAHYSFTISTSCDIKIWGRVYCASKSDDSFYIKIEEIDGSDWKKVNGNMDDSEDGFVWVPLSDGGLKPYSDVSPGTYTLKIQPREHFTKIDAFFISTDGKKPKRSYSGKPKYGVPTFK